MRYKSGDQLWVGDDQRRRYHVKLTRVDSRSMTAEILEELKGPPASSQLILGQALLKGERMDWVVQKATELGAARVVPLITRHGVVRPRTSRIDSQQERWQRIALEAA